MRVPRSTPPAKTTVLLFGPHFLSFDLEHFLHLRSTLVDPQYQWIHSAVSDLPEWWDTASQALPILKAVPGSAILRSWDDSFKADRPVELSFPLPNMILAPLLVITQLAQYTHHLRLSQAEPVSTRKETVGFCTGLLAATAVASSATAEELEKYGAVAIRLAMLIGALVDAADTPAEMGESVSYSIAWNSAESAREMEQIVDKDSEAYLSVLSDNKRATLTTSRDSSAPLVQSLKTAGVSVTSIGIRGRFHSHRYANYIDAVHQFCDSHAAFQFPDASKLVLPTRSNIKPGYMTEGKPHNVAIESILLHQCRWYQTMSTISAELADLDFTIVSLGIERSLPPSLIPLLGPKVVYGTELAPGQPQRSAKREVSDSDIAVIGMACKLPGADDLEEFWQLLCEGPSQHREVPPERMGFKTTWREEDPKKKWYGNFIRDYDAFDHKFFKKSPREAAAMDPQQRLMLQTAYQAVAQSGYFAQNLSQPQIGCYIGVSNVDYENNVACYPANAYSATGALKSFVAGKVSHYFGWTGPALTVDTACSAAAVALHQACQGILTGDCTEALAGGVNILASPLWYQNLAGASFLSPTGPCKPFDARADGYCRGEGCGAVFLKRAKAAMADGDQIFGIIAGTAVQQNENCTPITVPNSPSLSDLFENVLSKANVAPRQVSVVEAHGTGTAVGDPAEYESIRRVLGGSIRSDLKPLALGSVKSVVGHLECASGIVALLKVLLMLNKKTVLPQIGFESINPAIKATSADKMAIHTQATPWRSDFRAALINNYGASGSNASLVVVEAPSDIRQVSGNPTSRASLKKHPFWLSALDQGGLQSYSARLLQHVQSQEHCLSVDQLSFHLSRQSNRLLSQGLIFSCASVEELKHKLSEFQADTIPVTQRQLERPVILCFGGQVSTSINLNRDVFDSVAILRSYLDECNSICQSLNLDGIYPDIFQKSPIQDTVKLQVCLFSLQYACAKAWIACNVQVAAVVGHSFGEVTSLCVAGVLTLRNAIKLIAGRARIVRDAWGSDKGGMMAVEGDLAQIQRLLETSNQKHGDGQATIACVNGPRSFTLAGPVKAIDAVAATLQGSTQFSSMRNKRLNVSNAFHSTLVEPLKDDLERVSHDLVFNHPTIPIERATESASPAPVSGVYVAEHMRNPVFYNNAIQRLYARYPSAIWLEAGSNSTITVMAQRALGAPTSAHFQAVNLTSDTTSSSLADTFTTLWAQGLDVTFWPHHREQSSEYGHPLLLPPYQFETSRHMLEMKAPLQTTMAPINPVDEASNNTLYDFVGYQDPNKRNARFLIRTHTKKFEKYIAGHTVAHSAPLCPSTLQLELAIETIQSIHPELAEQGFQPRLQVMDNHNPLCMDLGRTVWLDAEAVDANCHSWDWRIVSQASGGPDSTPTSLHVSGRIVFRSSDDRQLLADFTRLERLANHQQCLGLLSSDDADDVIQGRNIYKSFAEVVEYGEMYQGVRKVVGKDNRSAGRVVKAYNDETWLDCALCDSFCQVAGVFVNCMTDKSDKEICISTGIEQLIRSPRQPAIASPPDSFDVLAVHSRPTDKTYLSDVFIFDPRNGELLGVILGIMYQRVNKVALGKLLARLTPGMDSAGPAAPAGQASAAPTATSVPAAGHTQQAQSSPRQDISGKVLQLVANISGADAAKIENGTFLADLGIDSLMGMELARDVEGAFNCTFDTAQLMELTDFASLVRCINSTLGIASDNDSTADDTDSQEDDTRPAQTAATTPEEEEVDSGKNLRNGLPSDIVQALDGLHSKLEQDTSSTRQAIVDEYVQSFSQEFHAPAPLGGSNIPIAGDRDVVVITGGTGSLGSHLVAHFASLANTQAVICLNRCSGMNPDLRQRQALESRSLSLDPQVHAKLKVIETDTSKPFLGLSCNEYDDLASRVTHIIHNAWPMTIKRPVQGFAAQFQAMRNLVNLVHQAASIRPQGTKIGFQFISSIATIGLYPLWSGQSLVPEARMTVDSTLPSGYGDAKLICEGILEKTLQLYPESFNAMVVRIGQIAGSSTTGYWNPVEHLTFLFKSSQTLNALPDFQGELSWCPVNDVAVTLSEILLTKVAAHPIYHVENPARQPWPEMVTMLADEMGIPRQHIIPFDQWLERMRQNPDEKENPARRVEEFLDDHFIRMACGGVIMDTERTRERSLRLRTTGPIQTELIRKYVGAWKKMGLLY